MAQKGCDQDCSRDVHSPQNGPFQKNKWSKMIHFKKWAILGFELRELSLPQPFWAILSPRFLRCFSNFIKKQFTRVFQTSLIIDLKYYKWYSLQANRNKMRLRL